MLNVLTHEQASCVIDENFDKPFTFTESVSLLDSLGRVLAEDITAKEDIPAFDRSTVDGYAVKASDTFGCSENTPAMLRFDGSVAMGDAAKKALEAGSCIYVPTGGEVPEGADSMVMLEYVQDINDGLRYVEKPAAPDQNMIFKGDDAALGQVVVKKGTLITVRHIGAMAALGYERVKVRAKLKVGIISTGDELIEISASPEIGQIRDVNSYNLAAGVEKCMAQSVLYGIVKDDREELYAVLEKALKECDIILISGGSSVGEKDSTADVIEKLSGCPLLFHGLSIKPGKPTICGNVGGKAVFGLPGHPLASYFIFDLFVRPLIFRLNESEDMREVTTAKLSYGVPSNHGREELVPVSLNGNYAKPIYSKSGLITVLARADGFIVVPRDCEGLSEQAEVKVILF